MRYNDDAQLDTSEVTDSRGGSGGGSMAGAGIIGLLIPLLFRGRSGKFSGVLVIVVVGVVVLLLSRGGSGGGQGVLGQLGQGNNPATASNTDLARECKTGADANSKLECAVVADINSVQDYWVAAYPSLATHYRGAAPSYTEVDTVFFTGQVSTRCGAATSDAGPFYCPGDKLVYIDLSFYNQLKSQFGAEGGPLVNAYVLAHEYGHHVQDLLGTESKVRTRQGASSDSVRLELQADCYAGVWMNHASQPAGGHPALITGITQADLDSAVDTAQRIGDDYIQKKLGNGTVDPDSFTHGSSAQRKKWLTTGYRSGDALQCDTFSTSNLG
ncbi:neutral zinc metallopeptidase [uncultured Jatrophihabitans sp.]|uniref:KPN_02809 family neutral zinc metallopeptidase n=1 Tax=uncultured Jatrophihabitans sp. TaxID=1610747 RepID=UPI0035C98EDF